MPDPDPTPAERLVVALNPSPEVRIAAAAAVARLAEEVGDEAVAMIADAAEHPPGIPRIEAATRAGITQRQLDYWTSRGLLATREEIHGRGLPSTYDPGEVVKARIMGSLVSLFEIKPSTAAALAEQILATGSAEVEGFKITRNGLAS